VYITNAMVTTKSFYKKYNLNANRGDKFETQIPQLNYRRWKWGGKD
jgi:hypothetical protein